MRHLILANVGQRKTRSVLTSVGVAVGAVLLMLTAGLARGQIADRARREQRLGAEILMRSGGASAHPLSTVLDVDLDLVPAIEEVEGVEAVVPIAQHVERSERAAFGFRSIDGIDFDRYAAVSGLRIIAGRPFQAPNEAIVDEYFASSGQGSVGDTVSFMGTPITIVGVYEPQSMSRIKIPIATVQDRRDARGFASTLAIKLRPNEDVERVARLLGERFPDHQVILTRDLPAMSLTSVPALDVFLEVLVGLAGAISGLVVLLTMYSTVLDRTRQIGILKSIGASRSFIIVAIEGEALLLSAVGVLAGYVAAIGLAASIRATTTLRVELSIAVVLEAFAVGIVSGGLGALYPAIRAARLDPVTSLGKE